MNPNDMRQGREHLRLTQQEAAAQLGVSQPYLSLLEAGVRRVPAKLAKKAAKVYGAAPTALPLDESFEKPGPLKAQRFAEDLASLGYPGFSYLHSPRRRSNPAALLLEALAQSDLESRLVEALPWLVLRYPQLDWEWLVPRAKLYNLQNRLGYVADLAHKAAEKKNVEPSTLFNLAHRKATLEEARLAGEGTLCHDSLSNAERSWLRETRPPEAVHWNLLTDLRAEQLRYVA
jgi:transcriptional regulator with XRE-family HTH domain